MRPSPISKFVSDQLSVWPLAANNFRAMKNAEVKSFSVKGVEVNAQYNPERIKSSLAGEDKIWESPEGCFLCEQYCPAEQGHIIFDGRKGRRYNIRVNPYPIFPEHLVIARDCHVEQSIWHCYVDMLDMARKMSGHTIFYNGPCSGASKPDHMHFQACPKGLLPLENAVNEAIAGDDASLEYLCNVREAKAYRFNKYARGLFVLRATTSKSVAKLFYRILDAVPILPGEKEPRFNLVTWFAGGEYRSLLTLRKQLRPHFFQSEGDEHYTMSIGCADAAGFFVVPVESEFRRIDAKVLETMVDEVTVPESFERAVIWKLTRTQATVDVGIMSAKEISFEILSDGAGTQKVTFADGRINYNGALYDEMEFDAVTPSSVFAEPTFVLHGVTIGVDFHWQREQTQRFAGALRFIVTGDKITAVNRVGIEDYLLSVISSEMKGTASVEFLKAHAVISRSWLMSQINSRKSPLKEQTESGQTGEGRFIKWFDHEDHTDFDVCADDHCQRYQGLGTTVSPNARRAVDETWGQVLTHGDVICDARFSKCCGGITETFDTCWEDRQVPYLTSHPDAMTEGDEPFCNTRDAAILSQVLNDYDLETEDFYRWTVRYSQDALSELVRNRSGIDFGRILKLDPVSRGQSGRIRELRITGTLRTMVIGKELLIRRWLSESHLKSSAFDVIYDGDDIVLEGRGWGHGVGLCQIGAAVMSSRGYGYDEILGHYYPGAKITQL